MRHGAIVRDERTAPPGPTNGAFAVYKDGVRQRFVLNNIPGNRLWSLARLQAEYTALIATDPRRPELLGLGPKLMPLPGPDSVVHGVVGAELMAGSDFENCFFSLP